MVYWNSFAEFIAMGSHGPYVWGSVVVTALCLVAEPLLISRQRKLLIARLKRQLRTEKTDRRHS